MDTERWADMAELADAPDLGSGGHTRAGSSPVIRMKMRSAKLVKNGVFISAVECVFYYCSIFRSNDAVKR